MLIEAIKQALPIDKAAKKYLNLTLYKRGSRYVACCPLHSEDTPSLTLFPDGGFKCFGCQERGDVIDLIGRGLKIDPVETIRMLANDLNIKTESQDRQSILDQIKQYKQEQAATVAIRETLLLTFLALAAMCRAIYHRLRDYEDYEQYIDLVHIQPILEGILDDICSPSPIIQATGYQRARRRFPWLFEQ